jgi:hypothetical protein
LNAAHSGKGDIQKYDGRMKLHSPLDGFFAIGCFPNYIQASVAGEN